MNKLIRSRDGRLISGVCLAVANRFGLSPLLVRILTVIGVVVFGLSIWVYVLLWILIPGEK